MLGVVVVEREHAAVRAVVEHDLRGAEPPPGDRERTNLVVGYDAAGVADHVRVPLPEPEQRIRAHARVHARDDGDLPSRGQGEIALVEALRVRLIVGDQLVDLRHPDSFSTRTVNKRYLTRSDIR